MELLSVISLFAISGSTINTTTMGICASAVITYKELEMAVCFLHVSSLKSLPSDSTLCEYIPLLGVRLKSYNMTLGCSYGWRASGKSLCEQEVTSAQVMSNAVFDDMVIAGGVEGNQTEASSEGGMFEKMHGAWNLRMVLPRRMLPEGLNTCIVFIRHPVIIYAVYLTDLYICSS
jgi:hypothetical protein